MVTSGAQALEPQQGLLIAGQGEVSAMLDNAEVLLHSSGVAPAVLIVGYGTDELPQYQDRLEALGRQGVQFFVCAQDLADPSVLPQAPVRVVSGKSRRIPGQAHVVRGILEQCAN